MNGNGYGMDDGWSWVFAVFLLVGLALLVLLAVRLFAGSAARSEMVGSAGGKTPGRSAARKILDDRLARGELSPTEYRDRLETLHEPL